MQGRHYITKRSFVKVNRDTVEKILIFSLFCAFPVGGSLLKFVDFPLVKNILSLPQRLFGFQCIPMFHSTQKRRYCASCAKQFKLTCRSFASLNLVKIWRIHSKTTYIMLGIEFYLFVSHGGMNYRGSTCKFLNARSAFRNLYVDPLSFIPPWETNK